MSSAILDKLGISSFDTACSLIVLKRHKFYESRNQYRKNLVQYFKKNKDDLDEDSLRRLNKNPLRILDSKNPDMRTLVANAPKLINHFR